VLSIFTRPTITPISLADAKAQMRIDSTDDDAEVDRVMRAAAEFFAASIAGGRTWTPTVFDLTEGGFPLGRDRLYLPSPPLASVTSVSYYDTAGDAQTLEETTDFTVMAPSDEQGWIVPIVNTYWPTTQDRDDALTVRFTAGYADRDAVPERAKHAIRLLFGHWWENREAVAIGTISSEIELSVRTIAESLGWGFVA